MQTNPRSCDWQQGQEDPNNHHDHFLKGCCYLTFTAFTFGGGLLIHSITGQDNMSVLRWMSWLYNRISPNASERRKRNLHIANMNSSSSSFYHDELCRALSEQSFGLTRYEVTKQYSAHEAAAVVTLLEGTNIRVYLNTRGYRVNFIHTVLRHHDH